MPGFKNRADAGRQLAGHLTAYAGRSDVVVLALPRGGVPVAAVVAARLAAPLDVFLVRKLGVPGHEELAMGAIAEGGILVLASGVIAELDIPRPAIDQVASRERLELDRRDTLYRGGRQRPAIADRTIILIDDGLATGATMEAAIMALREHKPARIVVAAPVGAQETCARLANLADQVVCPLQPRAFAAVGYWYEDFDQTTDAEVKALLAASGRVALGGNPGRVSHTDIIDLLRRRAQPLTGDASDYDALLDGIGNARVVLLGEATHGTHEFYRHRALITGRLIAEKGFNAVAVEADWPDAYRVNRYVRGVGTDGDAIEALAGFQRFPAWMWRNADVLDFIGWLRSYNEPRPERARAGFYGLDLYSLRTSAEAVLAYLDKVDRESRGPRARSLRLLRSVRRRTARLRARHPLGSHGVLRKRSREPARGAPASGCGVRDPQRAHRARRVLRRGAERAAGPRRGGLLPDDVRWAGRVVEPARPAHGRHAEGAASLPREEPAGRRASSSGRTTRTWGTRAPPRWATAASSTSASSCARSSARTPCSWDSRRTRARSPRRPTGAGRRIGGTCGRHSPAASSGCSTRRASGASCCRSGRIPSCSRCFGAPRLERAIGVIYVPDTERRSHYFHARLADQFDYVLHFDDTRAVEPLERTAAWEAGEVAETFPSGL